MKLYEECNADNYECDGISSELLALWTSEDIAENIKVDEEK
jgi:hypothetical protein